MKIDSMNRYVERPLRTVIIAATVMVTSAFVYAQTAPEPAAHQVTRAEVLHELEELEAVGYSPSQGDDVNYPADIQAAEQRVAAKHRAERGAVMGVGQTAQTKTTP